MSKICPRCGEPLVWILDEHVCGSCGWPKPFTLIEGSNRPGSQGPTDSSGRLTPTRSAHKDVSPISTPGRLEPPEDIGYPISNAGPEPPDPIKLTELLEEELEKLMKEDCRPEKAGRQRRAWNRPEKVPPPQLDFLSVAGCPPETQRKLRKDDILQAVIHGSCLKCPDYTGNEKHPCSRDLNLFTFCDGFAVTFGIVCPTILEADK